MRLYFLLISVSLVACCEDEVVTKLPWEPPIVCHAAPVRVFHPGEMLYGKVTGLKNCSPFVASAQANIQGGDAPLVGIVLNTYEDWGSFLADKEFISLVARAEGNNPVGTWPLVKNMPPMYYQVYYILQDHDVFEDSYTIDETYEANHFRITQVDSLQKQIRGSFDARFLLSSSISSGRNPDTILYSNCFFEAWHP